MHRFKNFVFLVLIGFVVGCTQQPASLEIKQSAALKKNGYSPARDINSVTPYKINVKQSQTLYQIAREYEVPIRDLIDLNDLEAPYSLMVGQQVKLPTPTYHLVRPGDTASDIARGYDVQVVRLIQANNLQRPYVIKAGQRLKIPSTEQNVAKTESAIDENETQETVAYNRDVQSKPLSQPIAKPQTSASASSTSSSPSPVRRPSSTSAASSRTTKPFVATNRQPRFSWPVRGEVISSFGPKEGGLQNDGINIAASEGQTVKASESGVVVYSGNELKGYGNLLLIKHDGGYLSAYAHMRDLSVQKGEAVTKGQSIATVGSTGHVDKPQLHFSIRKGRKAVNPRSYL